jgi:peptide/nickel transport system substrate-binding protein
MKQKYSLWAFIVLALVVFAVMPVLAQNENMGPGTIHNYADYVAAGNTVGEFKEAPLLAERVAANELPPVAERLPQNPIVIVPWNEVGQYGGSIRWDEFTVDYDHYFRHILNAQTALRDASTTTYYNAGVGAPDPSRPFIFEGWDVNEDATEFTIHLREGLKWSDGVELTSEDVRFRLEDEVFNEELNPGVTSRPYVWGGERVQLEVIDPYTFKLTFAAPYGAFIIENLREVSWGSISRFLTPSHFYKQYHKDHTDIAEILPVMTEKGFDTEDQWTNFYRSFWADDFGDSGPYVDNTFNLTLPVLYPWVMKEIRPDGVQILERNPYYYVVDTAGNQLPYVDRLQRQLINDSEITNLDIIAGKVDVQGQFEKIDDFPLYKQNEAAGNYVALPVRAWQHHTLIYWFNPLVVDEKLAAALSQVDFRRALSLALDRTQINEVMFRGLGTPAQFAPPSGTPLYNEELSTFASEYDPEGAKAILAELGYVDTNGDGFVEAPDGSEFILPITFYEVTPTAVQGAVLATDYWKAIGINVNARQVDGTQFWNLQGANEVAASVWWANGPDFGDTAFVSFGVSVPLWNQWWNTDGAEGTEPPDWAQRIREIQAERLAASAEERAALDAEGWDLLVKNMMIIGTAENVKNPLILNADLGNVQWGFDQNFVAPTYWEWAFQWYYTTEERRAS